MAKKTKPVKWAIGADEPADLQDFLSNDDLVLKHTPKKGPNKGETDWPGKGPFRFKVVRIKSKPNRNGDDRLSVMLVLDEPNGSDAASWNGYCTFDGFNVVEGPSLSFLKKFLKSLGLKWSDFVSKSKQTDDDPPEIVQIGKVKFGSAAAKNVHVMATVKVSPADDYNDDEHLEIKSYVPVDDGDPDEDDGAAESDAAVESFDGADEGSADGESDTGDSDPWTRADLEDEDFDTVMSVAVDDLEVDKSDIPKKVRKSKEAKDLLDWLEENDKFPEGENNEDEIKALREELNGKAIKVLQKRALKNDKDSDLTDLKKPGLVDLILQQELNVPPF